MYDSYKITLNVSIIICPAYRNLQYQFQNYHLIYFPAFYLLYNNCNTSCML